MIALIVSILLVLTFFFAGNITQAFKKFISLFTKYTLKILSFFGIRIKKKEETIKVSEDFNQTYKDIKKVKISKKNLKDNSSIDYLALGIFLVSFVLYLCNLKALTDNAITDWLYGIIKDWALIKIFVTDAITMNTFYTAAVFALLSFSATRLWTRWKETKKDRIERKQALLKVRALQLMESEELLKEIKRKELEKEKELK